MRAGSGVLALRVPPGIRSAVLIVGSLLAILAIAWLSLVTQPEALATTAWWPAAGIALGLGIRFPRRYLGFLALAVVAITLPLLLWAGRTVPLAVVLAVATGIEMVAGSLILRGRDDVLPTLTGPRDLGRLLLAVIAAAMVYDLLSAGAAWALGDTAGAWTRLITNAPKHAAGMMLLTPLFMDLPRRPRQAAPFEVVAQMAVTFTVAGLVFGLNQQMPLSFLPFVPLVWAALRLSTRLMLLEILGVAAIASVASTQDRGPFSFDRL
ncbi:MAG TPA: MASE1 domain-containing protein, partial [Mycobacterium sp.]